MLVPTLLFKKIFPMLKLNRYPASQFFHSEQLFANSAKKTWMKF